VAKLLVQMASPEVASINGGVYGGFTNSGERLASYGGQ
jgi:hypothetical protein